MCVCTLANSNDGFAEICQLARHTFRFLGGQQQQQQQQKRQSSTTLNQRRSLARTFGLFTKYQNAIATFVFILMMENKKNNNNNKTHRFRVSATPAIVVDA